MDKNRLKKMAKNPNHIVGIYNYCDRWCERCTFTSRCLTYAMEQEDELKDDPEANDIKNEKFWNRISDSFKLTMDLIKDDAERLGIDLDNIPDDPEFDNINKDRHEFSRNHPLTKKADKYLHSVNDWFEKSDQLFELKSDELQHKFILELKDDDQQKDVDRISDACDIIKWYFMQIEVKLARAFSSRFMDEAEDWEDEDSPNDSDGSAKVSLIGIDRSIAAWGTMLNQFPQEESSILELLVQLEQLRKLVEKEFPDARRFKRLGFDD